MGGNLPFAKMNGLGNDFVVFDARRRAITIDDEAAARIADRERGIGCDQLIILEPSPIADVFMRIRNNDGGEVDACGNASRCIALMLAKESGKAHATIATNAGVLGTTANADGTATIDMGVPRFAWQDIPLSEPFADTRYIELEVGPRGAPIMHSPSVVNVGNPHCIFWVDDVDAIELDRIGPVLEHHPLFPERANITVAERTGPDALRIRVWERGAGLTRACGTAACATAVAAARKRLTGRTVVVTLPGGPLTIEWRESDDHMLMTGAASLDYEGSLDPADYGVRI